MSSTPSALSPVLLYDGTCGLCAASVRFVLRHDVHGTLRFASLQGEFGREVLARHPALQGVDSVVWVQPASAAGPEIVLVRSAAALQVVTYLGGWWTLLRVARLIPAFLRDAVYDRVAVHRRRLTPPQCQLAEPSYRHRFLDR